MIYTNPGGRRNRWWRDDRRGASYQVDEDLRNEWLERANNLPGLELISICAGHRELPRHIHETKPHIIFMTDDEDLLCRMLDLLTTKTTKLNFTEWKPYYHSRYRFTIRIYGPSATTRAYANVHRWWEDILTELEHITRL